jgi:hypothetical protein
VAEDVQTQKRYSLLPTTLIYGVHFSDDVVFYCRRRQRRMTQARGSKKTVWKQLERMTQPRGLKNGEVVATSCFFLYFFNKKYNV